MDTNVCHLSTEYTEETECLADVGHDADDFDWTRHDGLLKIGMASVCSAVVIASRGGNDIMRKLMAIKKNLCGKARKTTIVEQMPRC